jgi:hypothetical protein
MHRTPGAHCRIGRSTNRLLGALFIVLLAVASPASALTPGEKEIEDQLGAPLASASASEVAEAAIAALKVTTRDPTGIVFAAFKNGASQFAPPIAAAALQKTYGTAGLTSPFTTGSTTAITAKRNRAAVKVVNAAFKFGLGASPSFQTAAGTATEITARAVTAVREVSNLTADPAQNPLQVVIKAAIKSVLVSKTSGAYGLEGSVAGAISQYTGTENADLATPGEGTDSDGLSGDAVIRAILATAGETAPKRIQEIGQAAGYAFAFMYLSTSAPSVDVMTFLANNEVAIATALVTRLPAKQREINSLLFAQFRSAVKLGITAAYADASGVFGLPLRSPQGPDTPVTDISGL